MYDLTDYGNRNFAGPEYLALNAMQFTNTETDEDIESIGNTISQTLQSNNKTKILFEIISEGLPYTQISTCQKIIKFFIRTHNFSEFNFAITSSAIPTVENINYYRGHCKRFDWVEVPVYFFNAWEMHSARLIRDSNSPYNLIDNTPRIKQKKFLCYNRNVKPHRLYLTTEIIKRGLLDKGHVSNYFEYDQHEFILWSLHETLPNKTVDIIKTLSDYRHLFPIDLGLTSVNEFDTDRFITLDMRDINHFNDVYFGIVTETKYATDDYSSQNRLNSDLSLDCHFLTEKTWKFIAARKPFLLAAFPNSLRMLRQMGYKTFHPFIDETYDSIEDNELRLEYITNEVERLCSFTDEQWMEWQYQVNQIVDYNYNKLSQSLDTYLTFLPKP